MKPPRHHDGQGRACRSRLSQHRVRVSSSPPRHPSPFLRPQTSWECLLPDCSSGRGWYGKGSGRTRARNNWGGVFRKQIRQLCASVSPPAYRWWNEPSRRGRHQPRPKAGGRGRCRCFRTHATVQFSAAPREDPVFPPPARERCPPPGIPSPRGPAHRAHRRAPSVRRQGSSPPPTGERSFGSGPGPRRAHTWTARHG